MEQLGLRLRMGLFFALIAGAGALAVIAGLWVGYARVAEAGPDGAFLSAGIIVALGIVGIVFAVWVLFDENVAKPIDALAAQLRIAPHARASAPLREARYLGDLAPAAAALQEAVNRSPEDQPETGDRSAERLMLDILSETPVAVIVVSATHQIVLYDGQACEILEREAPARVGGSVFDYLDEAPLHKACAAVDESGGMRVPVTLSSLSGRGYSGHLCKLAAQQGYTLMLEALDVDAERPPTFDVSLLDAELPASLAKTPLDEVTFVVFDTETTGLDAATDEVVQLAAVRVVRGQIVPGEQIDCLVNPGRPIPPLSTKVHRINDAMVADAPAFSVVCARFCSFATEAVVVAHNAPFDMAFIDRECRACRRIFDPAVLDTVLMSAVTFGGAANHTLDAICARTGVEIPSEARHTALGDARATAQVLLAMIRALQGRGIHTYGDYQQEARKHHGLMKRTAASGA